MVPLPKRNLELYDVSLVSRIRRNSSLCTELRPIVETVVEVGAHRFLVDITLTDRADMGVPMLLGREAIKGRCIVHPGRSFLLSRRKKKLK